MTTLEIYCKETRWQGGTIHQALADFKKKSKNRQLEVLNKLQHAENDGFFGEFLASAKDTKIFVNPPRIMAAITGVVEIELRGNTAVLKYEDGEVESAPVQIETPFNFMKLVGQVQAQRKK